MVSRDFQKSVASTSRFVKMAQMQVLIVEDDIGLAASSKKALEENDAVVDVARSVPAARDCVLPASCVPVILDLLVPDDAPIRFSNVLRRHTPATALLSITGVSIYTNDDHSDAMSAD